MVSKNALKQLGQLGQLKFRKKYGLFAVEGKKAIATFLKHNFELAYCFTIEKDTQNNFEAEIITSIEIKKLSNLSTPANYWAAFKLPEEKGFESQSLNLALDGIRDPGNLGTIIRLCDWFGIQHLICSTDTVDCFNPKVVQASMGSLAKVHVYYVDLQSFIKQHHLVPIGTDMFGENLYDTKLPTNSMLIVGNEGQGISDKVKSIISKNIAIPSYGAPAAESLNAAMATGILLSEFRRKE
ncbi:MAG: RNA methyltransferase [Flavobacteriaceae bacterium]